MTEIASTRQQGNSSRILASREIELHNFGFWFPFLYQIFFVDVLSLQDLQDDDPRCELLEEERDYWQSRALILPRIMICCI